MRGLDIGFVFKYSGIELRSGAHIVFDSIMLKLVLHNFIELLARGHRSPFCRRNFALTCEPTTNHDVIMTCA